VQIQVCSSHIAGSGLSIEISIGEEGMSVAGYKDWDLAYVLRLLCPIICK
jgi:hypothetical protein